ncbi:ABC transporter ATP-binding protein [Brachybacterium sp. FME24]|uniref:ABC transporter ATP-binding protein n=1 Tax=Brachybacterium sp. FME24 TaxID=2742605 RepID=UPI001866EE05|nr:ATP-binding cassette domain-containing protein [Brachybacterium sp. FME24]
MNGTLEISGLSKSYREPVLDHLDLTIDDGVFALLGPNGAGKTTLVSILTTLVLPDSGYARIGGVDVVTSPREARRLFAATGQETTLDDLLTGRENLVMLGRLLGLGRGATRRADALLEQFDLAPAGRRTVATYSGGMRRRLDLAASLLTQPAVLFLDEPTTGLDPVSRNRVWDDIRALAETGTTVFLTTQTLDEAEALADRIAVLRAGRLVADGTAEELIAAVGGQRLVLLDSERNEVRSIDTDGTAASLAHAMSSLHAHEQGLHVALRSPSLDDAFIALTQTHQEVAA